MEILTQGLFLKGKMINFWVIRRLIEKEERKKKDNKHCFQVNGWEDFKKIVVCAIKIQQTVEWSRHSTSSGFLTLLKLVPVTIVSKENTPTTLIA